MTEILDSSLSKPRLRRQRNSQLKTVGGVLSELGKVYRAYTNGNITAVEAHTRRALLAEIRTTIEGADVAERMNQIETRAARRHRRGGQAVWLRRRTTARFSYNLKGDCHELEEIKRNPTLC
jgi:hypothetical protein